MYRIRIIAISLVFFACSNRGLCDGDKKAPVAYAKQLSKTPATFAGHGFRPPVGWKAMKINVFMTAWIGAAREDGTKPHLLFSEVEAKYVPNLKAYLEKMLNGVKKARTDWRQSKFETVKINGLTFMKAEWSGKRVPDGAKMKGTLYVTISGQKGICMQAQDMNAHATDTIGKSVASMQTFQK